MASVCRSALMSGSRSIISSRSRTLTQSSLNSLNPKATSSSAFAASSAKPTPTIRAATRYVSVLGSLESMMPLHSAIASARLKSNIAFDSTCWSCLSQGLASPL